MQIYLYFIFTALLIQSCLHEFDIVYKLLNLEIAQFDYTIWRLCKVLVQLLRIIIIPKELHNSRIAQNPRLRGTCIQKFFALFSWCWHSQTWQTTSKQNSLSGYYQVNSRSSAIILGWNIWAVTWKSPQTTLRLTNCHSGRSKTHLAVSKLGVGHYAMGLNGNPYDYATT